MVPFAGWRMPVQYDGGIIAEHLQTRAGAGLFDVSHMAQFVVRARDGAHQDAARALESLLPCDLLGLKPGRQRYGFFTNERGGIVDDLMIANLREAFWIVANAAGADADFAHLTAHLGAACRVERLTSRGLLAIQGPAAAAALAEWAPAAAAGIVDLRFMEVASFDADGERCFVSRSGYTGEDGFEVSLPASPLEALAARLLAQPQVALAGLGARDSLRLEAGLCLYGQDLDADTTPVQAGLGWAIPAVRRAGGARAGGFPGADTIAREFAVGSPLRRVGLRPENRPVRHGAALFANVEAPQALGRVTSGTYSPSLRAPISMGYVESAAATAGTRLFAELRGERTPVVVCPLPFVPHRYHR